MNVYGYARVSTRSQSYEIQEEQIKAYCKLKDYTLSQLFADKESGATLDRPQYKNMMELLETNPMDISAIVVTKLDRIGRSIRDLLKFIDWCRDHNIEFIAFQSSIDTTTKEGRLFLYIMGALAEFERELIIERTDYGRKKFIEKNKRWGRKKKVINTNEIRRLILAGVPISEIGRRFKVSRATIYHRLEEEDIVNQTEEK